MMFMRIDYSLHATKADGHNLANLYYGNRFQCRSGDSLNFDLQRVNSLVDLPLLSVLSEKPLCSLSDVI